MGSGAALAALLVVVATGASEEPQQQTQRDQEAKQRAQALVKEGAALFQKGNQSGALEKFQTAYGLYPTPKLLFNLGQSLRALGRKLEAAEAFDDFLAETEDPPPEAVVQAQNHLIELKRELGRIQVETPHAGGRVLVDGDFKGPTPLARPVWVVPGRHRVRLEAPGGVKVEVPTDVVRGELQVLSLTSQKEPRAREPARAPEKKPALREDAREPAPSGKEAVPGATKAAPAPARAVAANFSPEAAFAQGEKPPEPEVGDPFDDEDDEPGLLGGRRWTWVALTATGVFGGGAVAVGLSMKARFDDLDSSCGSRSPSQAGCTQNDIKSVALRRDAANLLWTGAGVAAAATVVLYFAEGRSASVAVLPGGGVGIALGGRL